MANISNTRSISTDLWKSLMPVYCAACTRVLKSGERILCLHCRYALRKTPCVKEPQFVQSFDCILSGAFYLGRFHHGNVLQRLIYQMKYNFRPDVAVELGAIIRQYCPFPLTGTLVPVPQTREKRRSRGYNQARRLALGIMGKGNTTINDTMLYRRGNHRTQTKKNRLERQEALTHAFHAQRPGSLREPVWVVDDVVTSGATMNTCLQALRLAGIRKVGVIAVAWA